MTQWFAYGEDMLTFWALRNRLNVILAQLSDQSDANAATIFYRPSFGRQASNNPASPRIEFGEFDATVATSESIYLIEAKWPSSSEVRGTKITVRPNQISRHEIFAWHVAQYAKGRVPWDRFVAKFDSAYRAVFPGNKLAPPESKLAGNIEFILRELVLFNTATKDVLLYLHPEGSPAAASVDPKSFDLVNVTFVPEVEEGVFRLCSHCINPSTLQLTRD